MAIFSRNVRLPITMAGFDELVTKVVKKYKLPDSNHAAAVISVAIRHLPTTQAHAPLSYFGDYVLKNLANYIANLKSEGIKHKAQVEQLESILRADPGNQQARDELQKAANEGSVLANETLLRLAPQDNPVAPALN